MSLIARKAFADVLLLALAVLASLAADQVFAVSSRPVGLLVNGVNNPLAVERDSVRFTWRIADGSRGEMQTAFQLLISTNAERLAAGTADWWDSGRVVSDKSASVEYAGRSLPPDTRFWWKVRVWNQSGGPSRYSPLARFDTGLAQQDWRARFIWDGTTNLNNFAYFRKAFSLPRRPARATVFVTAHNDYLLYLNGHSLGRGPARSDPYHFGQYNAYDITGILRPGANAFAALGHWHGTWNNSGVNAKPAFRLEARLEYPDGSSFTITSDESWKTLAHTAFVETNATYFRDTSGRQRRTAIQADERRDSAKAADLDDPRWASSTVVVRSGYQTTFTPYGGAGGSSNRAAIQFDARREPAGWQKTGFDDSEWATATVVDRSDYHLFAQAAPAEREQAELKPVSITSTNGAWLVRFGQCIDGWPKLTLRGNRPGDVVRVEYFQMAGEKRPAGWDQYTCRGGTETWKPDFGRHTSFQELKITGYAGPLKASSVRGI
jgi:alpha-L-rhamnosidase